MKRFTMILFLIYGAILATVCMAVACEGKGNNEQTTSEEIEIETRLPSYEETSTIIPEDSGSDEHVDEAPSEAVADDTTAPEQRTVEYRDYEVISICGKTLREDISEYVQHVLIENDLEFWKPYMIAQMWQESGFDDKVIARNGLDMGILQYRITYWNPADGDILDYHAQIDRYVREVKNRLSSGCSIWETVSRHNTSDYGEYNAEYVAQVFQWIAEE